MGVQRLVTSVWRKAALRGLGLGYLARGPRSDRACGPPGSGQEGAEAAGESLRDWTSRPLTRWNAEGLTQTRVRRPDPTWAAQPEVTRPCLPCLPVAQPALSWLPQGSAGDGRGRAAGAVGTSFGDSPWSLRSTTLHPDGSQALHPGMCWGAGLLQKPAGRPMPSLGPSPPGPSRAPMEGLQVWGHGTGSTVI